MSFFSIFGGKDNKPEYPTDTVRYGEEGAVTFTFFKHASFAITIGDKHIYNDPVAEYAKYAQLPKADVVLVTHSHYDHLDRAAIDDITTRNSVIICDKTSAEVFDGEAIVMTPGMKSQPLPNVEVEAVAADKITEGHTDFHPQAREDCGYILTLGGTTIYVAGDTEDNEDVLALQGVDIAFLPVNQPYTMTIKQAERVVKAIKPTLFYPYHYGQVEEKTDIEALVKSLEGVCEVRVFPME